MVRRTHRAGRATSVRPRSCSEYTFRQRFRVPAAWAFRWCLDFTPEDREIGGGRGSRSVQWWTTRNVLLVDAFPGARGRLVRKTKLVHVHPNTKSWIGTHLDGPNHHSQFRYSITPDGRDASILRFEGRDIRWNGPPLLPAAERRLTRRIRAEDVALWRRYAVAMERDYDQR
jgi:hypothetical protein